VLDHKDIEKTVKEAKMLYTKLDMRKMDEEKLVIVKLVKIIQFLTGKKYK